MRSKLFITPTFLFIILVASGYTIPDLRLVGDSEGTEGNDNEGNETHFLQQSPENESINTTEEDTLFWAVTPTSAEEIPLNETKPEKANDEIEIPKENKTEATNDTILANGKPTEVLEVDPIIEENKQNDSLSNVNSATVNAMDEKITLERNNCHLEIMIRENRDLKIQIIFGKLESNTSGKCCITLNGEENSTLGVLITNMQLYQNGSQGEILQVVTADYGTNFVLKEYYSWSKYQPLILTETHRVYILLQYKVINIPVNRQDSHFNLEAFSYYKLENDIHQRETSYSQSPFLSRNDMENFYKKEKPDFIPYFY